jgi:hypothetical protein
MSHHQGDRMRKYYFFSSLVIFAAGFALSAIMDGRRLASMTQGTLANAAAPEAAAQLSRHQYNNWEYRVVRTSYRLNDQEQLDSELNRLGKLGFEVCGVSPYGNGPDLLMVVLKRAM